MRTNLAAYPIRLAGRTQHGAEKFKQRAPILVTIGNPPDGFSPELAPPKREN